VESKNCGLGKLKEGAKKKKGNRMLGIKCLALFA
jgi:hypothetical protein